MRRLSFIILLAGLLSLSPQQVTAGLVTLRGGGAWSTDCLVELRGEGVAFPTFRPSGISCTDGDPCDRDGEVNGVCQFTPVVCINVHDPALPMCAPSIVSDLVVKASGRGVDKSAFDDAIAALGLPSPLSQCTSPVDVAVPVKGFNRRGKAKAGKARLSAKATVAVGKENDRFQLSCEPATGPPVPPPVPGEGLHAEILGASVTPAGAATVTFTLTDDAGVPVQPVTDSTSDPSKARVRWLIARLEGAAESPIPVPPAFTTYVNYNTSGSSGQPTFDSGGSLALLDASTGTWVYTFGNMLPSGFPAHLTHTVGAQIERAFEGHDLVANPVFDFVPDGSPVTVVREPVTTGECNNCHNPLAVHGGGRREVGLCKLCHTGQPGAVDPDTGNTIEFKSMVHSIHRGKNLPTVVDGPVGTKYEIIGYNSSENIFGAKVQSCEGGPFPTLPCTSDMDCGVGGTCTGEKTVGVSFPQDIRNCEKCHTNGATAANHKELPSTAACTGCHNDVNPSLVATTVGPPGLGHLAGPQPENLCPLCHTPDGAEFGISVEGAHTIPLESAQLPGLVGQILSAAGAPGGTVQLEFLLTNGDGTPITDFGAAGVSRVRFTLNGPTSDYPMPPIQGTAFGNGSSGVLGGPDPSGVWTYETADTLPGDASGSWSVAMEARRGVDLLDPFGGLYDTVDENVDNPVLAFSVDGSPVKERREVVATSKCASCHGTTAQGFSFHGGSRNQTTYCVFCHNPNRTDFETREPAIPDGASPVDEPITFKHMIHKIHTGEELAQKPYIIYGHNSSANEFSEVLFPGNRADCGTCHVDDSHLLPLQAGLLPTVQSIVDMGMETVVGSIPVIQDACLACHDSAAAQAHALTNTGPAGQESCVVCHGEGGPVAVSEVHAEHLE